MTLLAPAGVPTGLADAVGVLREVGDLKRVRPAHLDGSVADCGFVRSWGQVVAGVDPDIVAARECATAVAGARLAGIDAGVLLRAGLTPDEVVVVLARAIDTVSDGLGASVVARVRWAVPDVVDTARLGDPRHRRRVDPSSVPGFVRSLVRQPRAGATAPGKPRVVVEPPESHADHCWTVAVYGALLAEQFGAAPGDVFLLGLAHHLHNATLPDAGFAGEVLLDHQLAPMIRRLTDRELRTLDPELARRLAALLAMRDDTEQPVGRAFNAADVLDRVLQVHHHARAAAFTADHALVDLELVHDGPTAAFHHAVLAVTGLEPRR